MIIQSLSVAVPCFCPNKCRFCVSHMHLNDYPNYIENNKESYIYKEYKKRLMFARDNGCNTMMITGSGEPLANRKFLEQLLIMNDDLQDPFRWIELQTSGVYLNSDYLDMLREGGVNTISLSLSSLDSELNADYNQTPNKLKVDIEQLCSLIKSFGFNLRLSLNLTDYYNDIEVEEIFKKAGKMGADQITFREFYTSLKGDTPEDKWIEQHRCSLDKLADILKYIKYHGTPLEILPFGAVKYALHGMSVVIDQDCMATELKDSVKYLILRPNAKLYSRWDDKGSLIF